MRTGRRPVVATRLGGASWLGRNVASRGPRYLSGSAKRLLLTALSLQQRLALFYWNRLLKSIRLCSRAVNAGAIGRHTSKKLVFLARSCHTAGLLWRQEKMFSWRQA